jgi:hypothetical protein
MRPLEAHCHFGLGQLYAQASDVASCRAVLGAAIKLYQQMGMSHWLSKAETALAALM